MRLKTLLLISAAVLATGGAGVVLFTRASAIPVAQADPRREPPLVRTVEVRPAGVSERAFTGLVAARVQSDLGFRVHGKVVQRLVDAGERVTAGQVLMRIDPRDLDLARAARDNAVAAAQAQLVQAEADEARYSRLVADGWTPKQRYEQARAAADTARAQLDSARAQAEVARNESAYAELHADADGTVVETLAEPGQVVDAGQVVVRLAHAGAREATIDLPETARPAIGSGAQARVYGMGEERFPARLRQLSDSADAATRTYEARYVLDGAAGEAPLGATVTVWVPQTTGSGADETEVPLGALLDDGRATGVWVVDPAASTVARRPVAIRRIGQESAIVTGLAPGLRVVALGAHLLHEGDVVRMGGTPAGTERTAAQ
ncbi:efflux RND transporter periplasmic adaptor subunit [Starkeya koreensis]|uniref:Efflux RND transporter periplasmic adaptor subunit n=1 Tax=Ancylobacter koreensis TaxID=266121 RepID=A0ABT0DHA6_9HYPH|nr:efflux RND transporter periplasmic adaptor subunit [Ancylobacter koreensis]MCK0206655.1 efflux RND transporter periplasmic adaptor subunit [Ancylobacter koreensis]